MYACILNKKQIKRYILYTILFKVVSIIQSRTFPSHRRKSLKQYDLPIIVQHVCAPCECMNEEPAWWRVVGLRLMWCCSKTQLVPLYILYIASSCTICRLIDVLCRRLPVGGTTLASLQGLRDLRTVIGG